jgi:glycosidase
VNPNIKIIAEQADWANYGFEYFEQAAVDRMFGFGLQKAILSFDKQQIIENAEIILNKTPIGKEQIIFIENHDIDRFASNEFVLEKQKTAAALLLLLGGVPSIYYGQEIGMKGKVYSFGNTDGNDIGRREAFDWYQKGVGKGMSFWYKQSGPWWTNANLKPNDGISLQEQLQDKNSLFNFYKNTIALKQRNIALSFGSYENVPNNNNNVLSFYRIHEKQKVLVLINLSDKEQLLMFNLPQRNSKSLLKGNQDFQNKLTMAPFQILIYEVNQ